MNSKIEELASHLFWEVEDEKIEPLDRIKVKYSKLEEREFSFSSIKISRDPKGILIMGLSFEDKEISNYFEENIIEKNSDGYISDMPLKLETIFGKVFSINNAFLTNKTEAWLQNRIIYTFKFRIDNLVVQNFPEKAEILREWFLNGSKIDYYLSDNKKIEGFLKIEEEKAGKKDMIDIHLGTSHSSECLLIKLKDFSFIINNLNNEYKKSFRIRNDLAHGSTSVKIKDKLKAFHDFERLFKVILLKILKYNHWMVLKREGRQYKILDMSNDEEEIVQL